MPSRYQPFCLAKDYQREVIDKKKCLLNGEKYIPLFTGINFSSKGNRTCARSFIERREIETMSYVEYYTLHVLEVDPTVTRIMEQYAHDPAITREEARLVKFAHPAVDGEDIIASTDFIVEKCVQGVRTREGISCKEKEEYDRDPRIAEKALIEAKSLARCGMQFRMQFDTTLPKQLLDNANLVLPRYPESQVPCDRTAVAFIGAWLTPYLELGRLPLATLCKQADRAGLLPEGTSLAVAFHLIARRYWPVDMREPIAGHLVLPLLTAHLGKTNTYD